MTSKRIVVSSLILILLRAAVAVSQAAPPDLTINGTILSLSFPLSRFQGEWLLPVFALSRAIGAEATLDRAGSQLTIRRTDGSESRLDTQTGDIRIGMFAVAKTRTASELRSMQTGSDLMLPLSAVMMLLAVDVQEDTGQNTLVIRSIELARSDKGNRQPIAKVVSSNYAYGMTTNLSNYSQFASFSSESVWGKAQIQQNATILDSQNGTHLSLVSTRASFRSGSLTLGDQTNPALPEPLLDQSRGVSIEKRFSESSAFVSLGKARQSGALVVDAGVIRHLAHSKDIALSGTHFEGSKKRGTALAMSFRQARARNFLKTDLAAGYFSVKASGPGGGALITDAFSPNSRITLSGTIEKWSHRFASVREDDRFNGSTGALGGVTLRPFRLVAFTVTSSDRQYASGVSSRSISYSASGSLPMRTPVNVAVLRSEGNDPTSTDKRFRFTQYTAAAPIIGPISSYVTFAQTQSNGAAVQSLFTLTSLREQRLGVLDFQAQFQTGASRKVGAAWQVPLAAEKGRLRLGVDVFSHMTTGTRLAPSLGIELPLSKARTLQVSYTSDTKTRTLQFQLRGSLFGARDVVRNRDGAPSIVATSSVGGYVYWDSDSDEHFGSQDQPITDAIITLDDGQVRRTDTHGHFSFDGVTPGAHRIHTETATLPAEFVFADSTSRMIGVVPNRVNTLEIRVVKTGRVSGRVSYIDNISDPAKPTEQPFPDQHIIASTTLDTYSETNGSFLLGDMPPGKYTFRVDPASIPAGHIAVPESVAVQVKAGESADGIYFRIQLAAKPLIEKVLPPQAPERQFSGKEGIRSEPVRFSEPRTVLMNDGTGSLEKLGNVMLRLTLMPRTICDTSVVCTVSRSRITPPPVLRAKIVDRPRRIQRIVSPSAHDHDSRVTKTVDAPQASAQIVPSRRDGGGLRLQMVLLLLVLWLHSMNLFR